MKTLSERMVTFCNNEDEKGRKAAWLLCGYKSGAIQQNQIDRQVACEALYDLMDAGLIDVHDIAEAKKFIINRMKEGVK